MADVRRFPARRRVQLGDAGASGRMRLDAVARFLQDIATDDARDAGLADGWVVRRTTMTVHRLPRFRDDVDLVTRCSGMSLTAAERCTDLALDGAPAVDTVSLWAFVGRDGRPQRIDPIAFEQYGIPVGSPRISTRLRHPDPPAGAGRHPWALRVADVDVLGHVNNALAWAVLEEVLARTGTAVEAPFVAEVEFRAALAPTDAPEVVVVPGADGEVRAWVLCGDEVRTSAWFVPGARPRS